MQRDQSALGVRFWALTDQAAVSLGNFLTNLVLVRSLVPAEFGVYSLLFTAILSGNMIHTALVTYPLAVRGASMSKTELRQWASGAITSSLFHSVALIGLLSIATFAVGRPGLFLYAGLAMLLWQLQETTRTAFFAHFRQRDAILGDAMSYLGQAGVLAYLSYSHSITIEIAFLTIAATSGAAFVLQGVQLKLPLSKLRAVKDFVSFSCSLGSWGLPSRLVSLITFQSFPWALFFSQGPTASAIFQAMGTAVNASNPVMLSTSNLIVTTVAAGNDPKRFASALRHAMSGWALVAPFFCFVLAFPALTLRILYGAHSEYANHQNTLRCMVLACALDAIVVVTCAIISGLSDTRSLFRTQAVGMIAALVVGVPLAVRGGVLLAIVGYVVSQTARVVYSVRICWRLWPRRKTTLEVEAAA